MAGKGRQRRSGEQEQQIAFLRKLSFFHDFDEHELRQFLSVSKWLKAPKGSLVIREGTTERAFYILVKGQAQVLKRGRGKKPVVLTTLSTGDCFGEMALVTEIKRTADVKAVESSFLLRIDPEIISNSSVFLQLKFYRRLSEVLATRLDLANRRLAGGAGQEPEPSTLHSLLLDKEEPAEPASAAPPPPPRPAKERPAETGAGRGAAIPPMPLPEDRLPRSRIQRQLRPELVRALHPAVVRELGRLLAAADATEHTHQLAELISLDPILSCRVIQAANSPIYRRATMVGTVPHAMVIVGLKNIREVVAGVLEEGRGVRPFGGQRQLAARFWRHGVVVGRIAELLKEAIRVDSPVDVYLAGLFHDLGMLGLDVLAPAFYPQLARKKNPFPDLLKAEKEFVGIDHGRAGQWLGERIGLPAAYLEVMRYHHEPHRASAGQLPVALVSLANLLARQRGVALDPSRPEPQEVARSFAWVLIQEQHRPFMDVNVDQFLHSFNLELDKTWPELAENLPW